MHRHLVKTKKNIENLKTSNLRLVVKIFFFFNYIVTWHYINKVNQVTMFGMWEKLYVRG